MCIYTFSYTCTSFYECVYIYIYIYERIEYVNITVGEHDLQELWNRNEIPLESMLGKCPCVPALQFSLRDSHFHVGQRKQWGSWSVCLTPSSCSCAGIWKNQSWLYVFSILYVLLLISDMNFKCQLLLGPLHCVGIKPWAHSDPCPHNNLALQPCFGKSCPKSMPPFWVQTKSGHFFLFCPQQLTPA